MAHRKFEDTMIEEAIKPFAIILTIGIWIYILLLIPFDELTFEGRPWIFTDDMNADGRVTIRDVWAMLVALFFYPGDLAVYILYHYAPRLAHDLSRVTDFFEVQPIWFGGLFSFLIALVIWPLLCLAFYLSYAFFLLPGRVYWNLITHTKR